MVLEKLEPKIVWEIFETLFTHIPHPSKHEDRIREGIKEWISEKTASLDLNITINQDATGNLLIKKAPSPGMESLVPVLLQGHMDMVCETDRADGFDFDSNAIPVHIQDNGIWVDAQGTTLGADNGIGVSLGLALLIEQETEFKHGPLEILLTVDEETGLNGAFGLDVEALDITSKLMINLDSEKLGVITIGAAGGGDTLFVKHPKYVKLPEDYSFIELKVTGLFGGHSGVDIHKPRGNANKLIARCLSALLDYTKPMLSTWNGGSKHNAIARESTAIFGIPRNDIVKVNEILEREKGAILDYYHNDAGGAEVLEPEIKIEWKEMDQQECMNTTDSQEIISTAHIIPHGPIRFSPSVEGLVETSNNFAIIKTENKSITFHLSTRSSVDADLESFRRGLHNLGVLSGWDVTLRPAYPGWEPRPKSSFLQYIKKQYETVIDKPVKIEAIHAGLECGIIGSKIPGIQMVSIGATIENPHTPDERVRIADVGLLYEILKAILGNISNL
jgi:dipeptidase D